MKLDKCSVCGTDRFDKYEKLEALWKTDIIVIDMRWDGVKANKRITVCPECRKKPFAEIMSITHFGARDEYNR